MRYHPSNRTDYPAVADMAGITFVSVEQIGEDELVFVAENGDEWRFYHEQDCCEYVRIEEVHGDYDDLVGTHILQAEEAEGDYPSVGESSTWTFYKFATIKGSVTVRWLGTSSGYYSERVSLRRIKALYS